MWFRRQKLAKETSISQTRPKMSKICIWKTSKDCEKRQLFRKIWTKSPKRLLCPILRSPVPTWSPKLQRGDHLCFARTTLCRQEEGAKTWRRPMIVMKCSRWWTAQPIMAQLKNTKCSFLNSIRQVLVITTSFRVVWNRATWRWFRTNLGTRTEICITHKELELLGLEIRQLPLEVRPVFRKPEANLAKLSPKLTNKSVYSSKIKILHYLLNNEARPKICTTRASSLSGKVWTMDSKMRQLTDFHKESLVWREIR